MTLELMLTQIEDLMRFLFFRDAACPDATKTWTIYEPAPFESAQLLHTWAARLALVSSMYARATCRNNSKQACTRAATRLT